MRVPLDLAAALFTGTSTLLLALHLRLGWIALAVGVMLWLAVALRSSYRGRRIWWMAASNVWTLCWAVYGYITWR